jgi:hypothetical protein
MSVFLIRRLLAQVVWTPLAWALLLSPCLAQQTSAANPPQTVQQLLQQNPKGGMQLSLACRDLLVADRTTLSVIISALPGANGNQQRALGTCLGLAVQTVGATDPAFATEIQQALAGSKIRSAMTAFSAATCNPSSCLTRNVSTPSQLQAVADLLQQNPSGGTQLSHACRDMLLADHTTLSAIITVLANANVNQRRAIGSCLGLAALASVATDPAFATDIQDCVAASGFEPVMTAFAAETCNVAIGAGGGGGGPTEFGAPIGGGGGGVISAPSVGFSTTGSFLTGGSAGGVGSVGNTGNTSTSPF